MRNKLLTVLSWLSAGGGALIPGYGYFTDYPPPIFPGISILTGVISAAIIFVIISLNSQSGCGKKVFEHSIRFAVLSIVAAFLFLSLYVALLHCCTVLEPQRFSERFQVGFWKFDWSLTDVGLALKQKMPYAPLEEWMLHEGAFRPGGPEMIWQAWSVLAAGSILLATYIFGFVLWSVGFSLLARSQKLEK